MKYATTLTHTGNVQLKAVPVNHRYDARARTAAVVLVNLLHAAANPSASLTSLILLHRSAAITSTGAVAIEH